MDVDRWVQELRENSTGGENICVIDWLAKRYAKKGPETHELIDVLKTRGFFEKSKTTQLTCDKKQITYLFRNTKGFLCYKTNNILQKLNEALDANQFEAKTGESDYLTTKTEKRISSKLLELKKQGKIREKI